MGGLFAKFVVFVATLCVAGQGAFACLPPIFGGANAARVSMLADKEAKGQKISAKEHALVVDFKADEKRYWELGGLISPICAESNGGTCTPACKDLKGEKLKPAAFVKNGYHYRINEAEWEQLKKEHDKLIEKWEVAR